MADESGKAGASGGQKKSSAGSLSWLWMLLAIISVGGFLTWLGLEAEPTSVPVVEEEDPTIMDDPSIPVVPKDTLAANKADYVAQEIRVHNVAATGTLGPKIFWGELGDPTNQVPILIRLDSAAAAGDSISGPFSPQMGAFYSVRGRVFPMNDSLAIDWGEDGEFAGEGEQTQAMFTDYYIQTSDIRPTPAQLRSGQGQGMGGPAADTASADTTGAGTDGEGDGGAGGEAGGAMADTTAG